jgi:acetoin utilization protein AcuA
MQMTAPPSKEEIVSTVKGRVRIRSFCRPAEIRRYDFDREFNARVDYKSLYTRKQSLVENARLADANVVLALAHPSRIIGFGVLAYPESDERWSDLGPQIMMEIKAIEVARSWRSGGIASRILKMLVGDPTNEDKILYMVGYSWTWDLAGTDKTAREYRAMLMHLFESCGFQQYQTNDPNVCLKPENVLMCRAGKNISQTTKDRFKWLRFGLSPWTWKVG